MDRRIFHRYFYRREDNKHGPYEIPFRPSNQRACSGLDGLQLENDAKHSSELTADQQIIRLRRRLISSQVDTIMTLVAAVEARDAYTDRHSWHVPVYAERLAKVMNLPRRETEVIKIAALLHDCGKIGVPDSILTKPGPLTSEEFSLIRQHPVAGAAILRSATCLRRELPLVLHHHERYDGNGYPGSLKGSQIPLGARILNVADALDAMICPRSYKRGLRLDEVAAELRRCRGTQFDPEVADVALRWITDYPDQVVIDYGAIQTKIAN